jgi:PAS domain S-box-containing protein
MQSEPKVNILLVDDRPENLLALESVLDTLGENLVRANSGQEALRCLLSDDFAAILLDVQMPGMNGFETAALIRTRARSRQTPIIFLTAFSTTEELVFKGYSLGAVDYLQKPIDPVVLRSKVAVFVDLYKKTQAIRQQSEELKQQALHLKAINDELKYSEERFRLLSACSPVGIFFTDTDGNCTYTNSRCQAICGLTPEGSAEEMWRQFIHPGDRDRVMADWSAYTYEGQEYSDEFRLQKPDASIQWVRVRSTPMLSLENELLGHVGTIEDITERKLLESARNQVMVEQAGRREAETANRMKDEFLAVLSHELRTPLNSILGWSKLLRNKKFDEKTTARALETIERNANTQSQLIEDILDVSQIIRGKLRLNFTPLSIVSVIQAAIDSVRPQAEAKAIEINAVLDSSNVKISGDPVRIQQVVWNLLTNAVKFTPENGKVEVKLTVGNERYGNFDDGVIPEQPSYAQIQVIDTGIGISPDFLPKVFDRFLQADSTRTRSHNGLGLGLAIVRHMVELHGGKVHAASDGKNQGATFTVKLPIHQPEKYTALPQVNTSAVVDSDSQTLSGINILVVDDEADTREFLAFALEQCGATIMVANCVSQAILTLQDFHPDVLISDIGMPDQDGYMLIRQIRELELLRGGSIPAIALTAYSQEKDRKQAIAAGFQMHLSKPVDMEELIRAIAHLLNQKGIGSSTAITEASISL